MFHRILHYTAPKHDTVAHCQYSRIERREQPLRRESYAHPAISGSGRRKTWTENLHPARPARCYMDTRYCTCPILRAT